MQEGYTKALVETRNAIEKRLTNIGNRLTVTPTFHRGAPDPSNLPDETLGVWLNWDDTGPDDEETPQLTILRTNWHIYIVGKIDGTDQFGGSSSLVEQVWGDIVNTFRETVEDIGLDGSIDYTTTPQCSHGYATLSGGDRRVEAIEMVLGASWQMVAIRVP
jgi:hypothetical protein